MTQAVIAKEAASFTEHINGKLSKKQNKNQEIFRR